MSTATATRKPSKAANKQELQRLLDEASNTFRCLRYELLPALHRAAEKVRALGEFMDDPDKREGIEDRSAAYLISHTCEAFCTDVEAMRRFNFTLAHFVCDLAFDNRLTLDGVDVYEASQDRR